ncbi:hypothetical protein HZS_6056 [Henneguya salminicola]|nr:hypothetical protein HZS_6056 [Henneguya salminicola]
MLSLLLNGVQFPGLYFWFNSRNLIASGAMDKNIILWDLAQTGKRVRSFQPKKGIIRGLSWHISDKEPLLVLCEKKFIRVSL